MTENGYVRYKGAWVLPQEIEIKEQERKEKLAQMDWANKLKRWNGWLGYRQGRAGDRQHQGDRRSVCRAARWRGT